MLNIANMKYRNVGNSGLKVSVIGFGNMINSQVQNYQRDLNIIKKCLESGINFFDTAQIYDKGLAQIALGKQLKQLNVPRQSIVISTKIWMSQIPQVNSTCNTNRKHIRQSMDKCLARLQMEYVDIIFAHAFDSNTSMEEICRGFNQVIEEGKAFYWATSNWNADDVFNAFGVCQRLNLHKPIAAQNQYNMLVRDEIEKEYRTLFEKYGYGSTIWSPLAGGFLTGKYLDGIPKDQLNRFNDKNAAFSVDVMKKFFYDPHNNESSTNVLKQIQKIAADLGYKLNHLALAWTIKFKYTSSAIIGARNGQQLEDNLKALELVDKLTEEIEGKINKLLGNNPQNKMNFILGKPMQGLRPVSKQ